jgi:L-aminopeptidase/D-esterase-like protein
MSQTELRFDWPELRIGVAEYVEGPTGCTVFDFARTVRSVMDVRGGSPGTFLAGDGPLDALCFAGGSIYGLEAVSGVAAVLLERRGHATGWRDMPIVRGAVIFDFSPRANAIYPDKALGRAAVSAARPGVFPLGRRGVGCSATVGKAFDLAEREPAGQGGAYREIGPTRVAVFTVVNAVGALVDRQGCVVRGFRDPQTGRRRGLDEALRERLVHPERAPGTTAVANTTLTAVVVNHRLEMSVLRQLARQVHSSLARAIQPLHGPTDGDVLYAITTDEVENAAIDPTTLGVIASELAWDAVLASPGGDDAVQ